MAKFHNAILALTAINFAMMAFYTMPVLMREAGGLLPFDLRLTGYSATDVSAYLAAISNAGRTLYLTTQSMLDSFFPTLLALFLMVALYRLAPKWPALFLTPLAGALFDYYENAAIHTILRSQTVDSGLVEMASLLTSLKFASVTLSLMAILLLWWKGRANG